MTGKDLIIYILQNNLEDAEVVNIVSKIFLTDYQVAAKFKVGVDTIRAWQALKLIDGINIRGAMYYYDNISDPRIKKE